MAGSRHTFESRHITPLVHGRNRYNVQAAVDTKHHLIVAHEVTNDGVERDQLSAMAKQARDAMGVDSLLVVADRSYFKSEAILACHEAWHHRLRTQGQDLSRCRSGSIWS